MPDAGRVATTLAEAKRIADGLQLATRFLGKKPDFYGCGGPAAEAYWAYFTPTRISSLLTALEAVLEAAETWRAFAGDSEAPFDLAIASCAKELREAITTALTGQETGE